MADLNKPAFYPRVGNITPKPRAPLAQTEVREQPLDPIMRVFKDLMDRSSALLDKSKVSPFDVTKGLISAIPFEGERFAKDFDKSTMPIPTGFGLLPKVSPQGIDTSEMGMQSVRVPTKEALNELKWSDLVGTAGASRMFEALGQNRTPELFDTLDATMLGLGGLSAARAVPKVAKAVGEGAKTVGMGGLEMIDRGMFGEGPLRNFVPQHKFVIKPKGGNWIGGDVEKALDPLITKGMIANREIPYGPAFDTAIVQRIADLKETASKPNYKGGAGRVASMLEEDLQDAVSTQNRVKNAAINKWVQSNLTNYVKKDMGTPDDPVRKLAEQDISHLPQDLQNIEMTWTPEELAQTRKRFGFPEEETATNPTAKMWEQMADEMIAPSRATEFGEKARQQNPWLEKLNPYDTVYETMRGMPQALKFDHIIDVLREDIAAGRIRPEQLNKVSMEQAVRRTYEYDQEMARKLDAARLTAREGLPVYKDYPEGLKWVELNRPGDFSAESDAMGHSVRGYEPPKGHPDWTEGSGDSGSSGYGLGGWEAIKSGDAKVYSLVDAKGEPHVTIEVGKARPTQADIEKQPQEVQDEFKRRFDNWAYNIDYRPSPEEIRRETELLFRSMNIPTNERINQIKGKQNAAPKENYLPFVQDFVKGGEWSDVNDLQNTGLTRYDNQYLTPVEAEVAIKPRVDFAMKYLQEHPALESHRQANKAYFDYKGAIPSPEYSSLDYNRGTTVHPKIPYTYNELKAILEDPASFTSGKEEKYDTLARNLERIDELKKYLGDIPSDVPPLEGMRRGGKVSISNNPDTMMMELGNQKFGIGGLATVAKNAKKVAEPMKASEALGKIEGRPLKITQSDRTKVGGGYLGGPGFSSLQLTEPEYRAAEAAWGVQNAGTAKTILGGGKKGDNAVYAAMIGTPTQHQSNQMVFDKLYGDFKKAAKRGELTPELRDLINMRLAASVDKKGNPVFPADVDIMDKNFRNIADTFSRRSIAGHLMGGVQVGGKKGQIIDYDKIIRSTTDPALIDQPTGALGNRLFTLSGGIVDRPDLHPAFPAILQGEDLGLTFTPVERNLVMKDFVDKTMREKKRMPGYMDYTRGNPPTQLITEDILTELQKLGLKKGGGVKQPAAYIDGNEFVEAAQKYGIKDSMSNLNMIVNLVNKGLSVDDAARQVSDSGMHKAAGGAITGDDLILEERPL